MNLQQLRYLCAIVDNDLNVSDAADSLFTSQPGGRGAAGGRPDERGTVEPFAEGLTQYGG